MEKRVVFKSAWLPYVLVAPQIAVTVIFFFWPAYQAIYQSLLLQDAFGLNTEFVWFDNFKALFNDENYLGVDPIGFFAPLRMTSTATLF